MNATGKSYLPRAMRMVLIIVALAISSFALQQDASASSIYGKGVYGECKYQRDCAQATPPPSSPPPDTTPTVTTTPSGLEVAINLTNDQVMPRTGYTITLTPLNGAGETFQQALIYIDDQLVATVIPGSNGTGEWFWDTILHPGTNVRIVITDQTGQTTTQTFRVRIANEGEPVGPVAPLSDTPASTNSLAPFTVAIAQAGESLEKFILFLPKEVAYAFPWIIFILIATQITILFFHTRREADALHNAETAAERLRTLGTLKSDFMNLLAHHLRTPLTTLQGGLELQAGESAGSTAALESVTKDVRATIESIITEAKEDIEQNHPAIPLKPPLRAYLPFVLLLVGAGVLAFGFIFLANTITAIQTSTIDLIIQVLVYLLLSSFAIICLRLFRLRQTERSRAEMVLSQEKALQTARDNAIEKVDQRLHRDVKKLDELMTTLPPTGIGVEFIKPALADLTKLSDKCYIASQLSDTISNQPTASYTLSSLYDQISESLQTMAAEKHVSLDVRTAGSIETSKPELVSVVLKSVLENAIAYAPENSTVSTTVADDSKNSKIIVSDSGQGITKEQLTQLFQPFYKAEGSETYNHQGMGFSLYLDKLIMTYLGGTIEASSELGSHTDFTISLPHQTASP